MAKRKRPHPAARTRAGLALGSIVVAAGLTGSYWLADSSGSAEPAVGAVATNYGDNYDDDEYDGDDEYERDSVTSGGAVAFSPSARAPDTSSRAS